MDSLEIEDCYAFVDCRIMDGIEEHEYCQLFTCRLFWRSYQCTETDVRMGALIHITDVRMGALIHITDV